MKMMKYASPERIHALIDRLTDRNRLTWAARIYGNWLEQFGGDNGEGSARPPLKLWRYGRLLRDAGDHLGAANVFRELATNLAQEGAGLTFLLMPSFEEWAKCLGALGMHQSAEETRILGRRAAARTERQSEENSVELRALSPSRLIRPVATRITFMMSLEWEGSSDTFDLVEEQGVLTLRDRFRAGDPPGPRMELEVKAPAEQDPAYPHLAVCVKFPWCFARDGDHHSVLALVNNMNLDNAACSTCLEPESGQIAVRSRIGYAGFNNAVSEKVGTIAAAQQEATLNVFAEVLGTAISWAERVAELSANLSYIERPPKDQS